MTNTSDNASGIRDDSFRSLCAAWRQHMLDVLQEYQDVLIACEQIDDRTVALAVYGERFSTVLELFRPTPVALARMIAEYPDRGAESEADYLRMLFADMRNPISSLTAISTLLQIQQSSDVLRTTPLELLLQQFAHLEQRLNALLTNLLRYQEQYASATE